MGLNEEQKKHNFMGEVFIDCFYNEPNIDYTTIGTISRNRPAFLLYDIPFAPVIPPGITTSTSYTLEYIRDKDRWVIVTSTPSILHILSSTAPTQRWPERTFQPATKSL